MSYATFETIEKAVTFSEDVTASSRIICDDTTEATTTTDGSLQTDGGISVAKSAVIGDDLDLLSDGAILNFGADKDVNLTHVADTGLLLNSTRQMRFGDSGTHIAQLNDGHLDLTADTSIDLNGLVVGTGRITTDDTTEATTTTDGSLQTDGGLSVAKSAVIGDDVDLLSDAAILNFGADKDVNLTHVADTGLLLNTTMQLQFRDAAIHIASADDGHLDLTADTSIDLNGLVVGTGRITTDDTTEATTTTDGSLQTDGGLSVVKGIVFGGAMSGHITTVADATYNLTATDLILHVTRTASGTCTITLPTAQLRNGRMFYVKDAGGNASTYNITIDTQGAETIDGEASVHIDGDYEAHVFYSDGSNWFIL